MYAPACTSPGHSRNPWHINHLSCMSAGPSSSPGLLTGDTRGCPDTTFDSQTLDPNYEPHRVFSYVFASFPEIIACRSDGHDIHSAGYCCQNPGRRSRVRPTSKRWKWMLIPKYLVNAVWAMSRRYTAKVFWRTFCLLLCRMIPTRACSSRYLHSSVRVSISAGTPVLGWTRK